MKIFRFNKESGKQITQFNSCFIMNRILETKKEAYIGCMYLEENGIIGLHQAVIPQLLLIVSGIGYVRGEKNEGFKLEVERRCIGIKRNGMKRKQILA
ncbi:hypothetical protein SAFG77S_10485 [Streptomyces afghaniensis]